ncbi:Phospholipase [Phaffia rhodozyma]|uniref:Phospholipase n=1 Tax=Phaffia rhodozyma TaxID=264483 RepID=A0A0F7SE48_PHARH|nr:Phospholipase [Phaffia rhodozyma]
MYSLFYPVPVPRSQTQKTLGSTSSAQPFNGTWVKNIKHCPHLPARDRPSESVWDLRPDEFSYTMALGDSITAGWFLRGIQSTPETTSHEFRGASWAAGGDHKEITLPNLLRYYSSSITGFSRGDHPAEICYGHLCPLGPVGWTPRQDRLNAALSGSLAENLPHQARDYLVPMAHYVFEKHQWGFNKSGRPMKWTYLNLQIGSNDLCALCSSPGIAITPGSPDLFELNVRQTLEIVRKFIPGVMINIGQNFLVFIFITSQSREDRRLILNNINITRKTSVGVLDVSKIHELSDNGQDPYCAEAIELNEFKCSCALRQGKIGELTRSRMKFLQERYNERLVRIVEYYQGLQDPMLYALCSPPNKSPITFVILTAPIIVFLALLSLYIMDQSGTVFQPGSALNMSEVPIEALSSA